jgi:hypothetical protein
VDSGIVVVYPNPSGQDFAVAWVTDVVAIYNILGQEVMHINAEDIGGLTIHTTLPSGIYFVRIGDTVYKHVIIR